MRHARRYWLKAQAEKAVDLALEDWNVQVALDSEALSEYIRSLEILGYTPEDIRSILECDRKRLLTEAAGALAKAELLHREAVKR